MSIQIATIGLEDAETAVAAALRTADTIAASIAVVVVDRSGRLVAASRMDDAPVMAIAAATGKAYTAVGMGVPTAVWEEVRAANPGFGGAITAVPGFTPFTGGAPVIADGQVVGGIGVMGGTVPQDIEMVTAAVEALQ